jgi:hypothetical protein
LKRRKKMNTFSQTVVNSSGERITVTTGTLRELVQIVTQMGMHGWTPEGIGAAATPSRPTQAVKHNIPNVPPNVPPCPHHPKAGMGHDKSNPGQFYCLGKVDGKWCGYKASSQGVVRMSILDVREDDTRGLLPREIDF